MKKKTASCVRGQIGRCRAPCENDVDPSVYTAVAQPVARALAGDPSLVLDRLGERIERLSESRRYEEAAATTDRLSALVATIRTARAVRALQRATVALNISGRDFVVDRGFLRAAGGRALPVHPDDHPHEPKLIASWLARNRARVRVIDCSGSFDMPVAGGRVLEKWSHRLRVLQRAPVS